MNKVTLNIEIAGTLDKLLSSMNRYKIESLELIGKIDYSDIQIIRRLSCSKYSFTFRGYTICGNLSILDISKVLIIKRGSFYQQGMRYFYWRFKDNIIASEMFSECDLLSEIILPASITAIGDEAFYSCSNLKSIVIPPLVSSIGYRAFAECNKLESIILPEGLTNIEEGLFKNCTELKSIELPPNVTCINAYAFHGCRSLMSIKFPEHIIASDVGVFQGCTSLDYTDIYTHIKDNSDKIKSFHDYIKKSVDITVRHQKNEVLAAIDSAINSDIVPEGTTLEEKLKSYKMRLQTRIDANLDNMPRTLFEDSAGVVTVTPKYYMLSNGDISYEENTQVPLHEYINRNELLNHTVLNSFWLGAEDIDFYESDKTFSIEYEGIIYTFEYDGFDTIRKLSSRKEEIIPNTEKRRGIFRKMLYTNDITEIEVGQEQATQNCKKEFETYRRMVYSACRAVFNEGTKQVDTTQMSKIQLIRHNRAIKITKAIQLLTAGQMEDIISTGFAASEADYGELIEQYAGVEMTPEMAGVAALLSRARTEYIKQKQGKSNC